MTAKKNDSGKPDYTLLADLHPGVLDDVIRILEFGAKKYDRSNWVKGRGDVVYQRRIHAAIFRHALASLKETNDAEHGFPHLCALVVDALFVESLRRWSDEDATLGSAEPNPFGDVDNLDAQRDTGYTPREVDVFYEGYECRRQEEAECEAPERGEYFGTPAQHHHDFFAEPESVVDALYVRCSPSRIAGDDDNALKIKNRYYKHDPHFIAGYCANCDLELTLNTTWVEGRDWDYEDTIKFCSLGCVEELQQWQGRTR